VSALVTCPTSQTPPISATATCRLYPGDVLLTGTPEGVGPVGPGDVMVAEVERIGSMTVTVRSA
jgi:2-keto-4-pentenoate hydratase/2-oxohepta-3-ene-1,7-dioic acid hydratase in catechol pathway